jgi:hypothetical protein
VESALTTAGQFSYREGDEIAPAGFVQKLQIASVSASSLSSVAATFANANNAGDILCILVDWYGTTTSVSVSDTAGNTWTILPLVVNSLDSQQYSAIAYVLNCRAASAGNVVTASFGTAQPYIGIWGAEYQGYSQLDGSSVSATGTHPSVPTLNITTTIANDVLVGFAIWDRGAKWSGVGPGFTLRAYGPTSLPTGHIAADNFVGAAGTYTFAPSVTGANSGNPWMLQVIAFK